MFIPINFIILLLFIAGVIWLQLFLSKKSNKWLGLILPAISFAFSFLTVLNIAVFDDMSSWDTFITIASTFLISNIPTVILLAIYVACRERIKKNDELQKMNIQDL